MPPTRSARRTAHGDARHIAMPLGGIGTGNVSLCADGSLRQWQLHNTGNHLGELPGSFFAVRISQWEPPFNAVRVLQAPPGPVGGTQTPLVNDDHVPRWQRELLSHADAVSATTFSGTYPFATVDYEDESLPVRISLEAFTPMAPLDLDRSSIPVAMFTFTITNTGVVPVNGWFGGALQNAVGGDGILPPDGVRHPGYGGNTNRVHRSGGWTSLIMENHTLPGEHPGAGQMVLTADAPLTTALPQWSSTEQFLSFLRSRQPFGPNDWDHMPRDMADPQPSGTISTPAASPTGSTWNGGLAAQFSVEAGETVTVRFALAWHFPNRHVNFTQFGGIRSEWGATRFLLGNHYTTQYADAVAVAARVQHEWADLERISHRWTSVLEESSLDDEALEHMAAQASIIRSPSFFRTADGHFFGFEGVQGASTPMWSGDVGGSCPLNCTHVFAYAQGVAELFPEIERDMRECELDIMQAPQGFIPHRVLSPTHLPQLWDRDIGGPGEPALDGMLSTVLKSYREVRKGAGLPWLERYWPRLQLLMNYIAGRWDPDGSGMLHGIQPSTHDIDLAGLNPFMGTLWLAALRAMEEMGALLGRADEVVWCGDRFKRGSRGYDDALFNGEYFVQVLEDDDPSQYQWESGCLADQLIGQWWAHQLGLGYVLPADHVRTALESVVRYNLRVGFRDFDNPYRTFADADDTGLLMCTWPLGGRPEIPTRYCDEVWTGSEQQVAAHCIREGLIEEADQILRGLWGRYDGSRRNPYNHIECGDHYVRALSGWSVLQAWSGLSWDASSATLEVRAAEGAKAWPLLTDSGWGLVHVGDGRIELSCRSGRFSVDHLVMDSGDAVTVSVRLAAGESQTVDMRHEGP